MADHLTVDAVNVGTKLIDDVEQALDQAAALAAVLGETLMADAQSQPAMAADGIARLLRGISRDVGKWNSDD